MVNQSNRMKDCFRRPSLVAYKGNKNLGEILIRAKVPIKRSSRKKVGFNLCGRLCYACIQCKKATFHKCKRTGKSWRITSSLNCESKNVIYKIGCKKCDWVYIGETERKFCERLTDHRGYVRRKENNAIGIHFNSAGHDITDMEPLPIEQIDKEDTDIRRQREKIWIQRYDAVSFGGNSREKS